MENENELYQQEIPEDEDIAFMPDGYAEGDDFFDPDSWTGETNSDSASENGAAEASEGELPEQDTDAPATGQNDAPPSAEDGAAEVPATDIPEETAPSSKRRVKYRFNHEDVEEDIDLDNDLPEILQKSRSTDRYKERLDAAQATINRLEQTAKAMKYDTGDAFLDAILDNAQASEVDSLKGRGVDPVIAEDYVSRKYADALAAKPKVPNSPVQSLTPSSNSGERDYTAEARELIDAHPELKGQELPAEVYTAITEDGKSFLTAYEEYERKVAQAEVEKVRSDAEKLRKENRILKNNADSAERAPVSGVSKGGRASDNSPDDPFLKGFNSDSW